MPDKHKEEFDFEDEHGKGFAFDEGYIYDDMHGGLMKRDKPLFKNKENENVKMSDGRTLWLSRSCAVAITSLWSPSGEACYNPNVLLVKRSSNPEDPEEGRYCLPCGYLDYNETLYNAAIREFYEETGVYLPYQDIKHGNGDDNQQPWYIHSKPSEDALQNITSHFGFCIMMGEKMPEFKPQESEIELVKLVPVDDLDYYDVAFNHIPRIRKYVDYMSGRIQ